MSRKVTTRPRAPRPVNISNATLLFVFAAYIVFVVVMLNFVPISISNHPNSISFSKFMAQVIPMLNEITKIPGYDPFLNFYYAVVWVFIPVFTGYMFFIRPNPRDPKYPEDWKFLIQVSWRRLIFGVLFCISMILICAFWPVDVRGSSWRDASVISNGIGIGFWGFNMMVVFAFLFLYLRLILERFVYDFFTIHQKGN